MSSFAPQVFIVDDDAAVRRAVSLVARSLGHPVQAFASAEEFLHAYDEEIPGCLVLDARMPTMSGLELQKMLRSAGVRLPTIMISGHADVRMAVEAMSQGAFTFLEKPFRMNELTEQIGRAVARDLEQRSESAADLAWKERMASLSPKEREVLEQISDGKTNKEMAAGLEISLRTVEDRRARMMRKLGVSSLAELHAALRRG